MISFSKWYDNLSEEEKDKLSKEYEYMADAYAAHLFGQLAKKSVAIAAKISNRSAEVARIECDLIRAACEHYHAKGAEWILEELVPFMAEPNNLKESLKSNSQCHESFPWTHYIMMFGI